MFEKIFNLISMPIIFLLLKIVTFFSRREAKKNGGITCGEPDFELYAEQFYLYEVYINLMSYYYYLKENTFKFVK